MGTSSSKNRDEKDCSDSFINPPTDTDQEQFSSMNFFEHALFWLDQSYPEWKETLIADFGQRNTICIPDSMDMGLNKFLEPMKSLAGFDKEAVEKAKLRIREEEGKAKFFNEFRKLKLGGILIHGFDAKPFFKVMQSKSVTGFEQTVGDKHHFECNFIFIHQRSGVVVFEIKGCDRSLELPQRFKEASEQLNRQIDGLKYIFQRISGTGTKSCPFTISGNVCMPYVEMATPSELKKKLDLEKMHSHCLLDKLQFCNAENFENFCKAMPSQPFTRTEEVMKFIIALLSYRPATSMSSTLNAMEYYRRIERQEFKNTKMDESETIFFNNEQLKAIECSAQRVLISGPPGTGKTLCLIQRVLNAAKIDKPGRVVLLLPYAKDLNAKFTKIIDANQNDTMKRKPVIDSRSFEIDLFSLYTPEDDVFVDEISVEHSHIENQLAFRSLRAGSSTTIAITGSWQRGPIDVVNSAKAHEIYADFDHFELKTVIRGTKNIIDEWKCFFPDRFIRIGHNITGSAIERYSVTEFTEMFEIVRSKVASLITPAPLFEVSTHSYGNITRYDETESGPQHCKARDIAVIIANFAIWSGRRASKFRKFLRKNKIRCGSVEKQVCDPTLVAVDGATAALSYEWPIVIVVSITDGKKRSPAYLIATSRAIAKLIIIDVIRKDAPI